MEALLIADVFDAVRSAAKPGVWSRGVELTRTGTVVGESRDEDELRVRVTDRQGLIARTVRLYLDDATWECTCGAPVCEHAAAAVIAARASEEAGEALPAAATPTGHVAYRFTRAPAGLALERGIAAGDAFHPFESTLASLARGRGELPHFVSSQADLAAELALGTHRRGVLPRHLVPAVLRALRRCEDVTLDGDRVEVSGTPVVPRVVVEDQDDGFRLVLEPDPTVTERFANGVALCRDGLRPIGEPELTGRERHELPSGVRYGPERLGELVQQVVPSLRKRGVPVEVRTTRLPDTEAVPPRVVVELRRQGIVLDVLATIVYGDPPRARVDAERVVHLGGPMPIRDERAEQVLTRMLGAKLGLAPGVRASFAGPEAVAFGARLRGWEGEVRGRDRFFDLAPPILPRVVTEPGRFEVTFETELGGRHADAGAVLRAWRDGESLVPLLEGGWSPIPQAWLDRHGERVADLLAARDREGRLPPALLPDLGRLCEELGRPRPPELDRLRGLVEGFTGIPPAALPEDLRAELRPYQRAGVDWLVFLREAGMGALLADDMGLGKTLQALCAVRGRTLVVCPTSVLHGWAEQAARFRPGLRVSLYHGPRRALDPAADLTVTSYALLRLDADALAAVDWDTVVLDEAQNVKNPESQAAQAAFRLRAGFRVAMTGTPVENRLDELWSQLHFLNPGLLGGRDDFAERYARPIAAGEPGAAARLRERIRPFLLRRLKDEVAPELPPRTHAVLRCELSPSERVVYDAVFAASREDVVRALEAGGSVLAALEALLRLRQAACHPALVPGQQADTSSKVALLLESLDTVTAEGHKALVFSQWTSLLDLIEPHLRAAAIPFTRLDGSTVDRRGVVASFQDPAGPPVLLVSLKAGGSGLTLTAADHVFLMDPWWNPAVEDQAADRAHRIGQERPVLVYRLVAEDTVEERILVLQEAKRAVAEAALGEADQAASITREELLALLA